MLDKQTNQAVYRFRPEVAEQKNLMEIIEVNFDITTDKTTRERYVHVKNLPADATFQGTVSSGIFKLRLRRISRHPLFLEISSHALMKFVSMLFV